MSLGKGFNKVRQKSSIRGHRRSDDQDLPGNGAVTKRRGHVVSAGDFGADSGVPKGRWK